VTGAGGLNQAVTPVNYINNTDVGTATASASYIPDSNHFGSSGTKTFAIIQLTWAMTASDGCTAESLDVSISGNAISMGHISAPGDGSQPSCIHGATALLPSLGAGNSSYKVTFEYDLATWDAYNAFVTGTQTGYWDSFSVSVSGTPYQNLSLSDPITTSQLPGLAFIWGGSNYGDGILECNPSACTLSTYATATAIVPGTGDGSNYLNVVLDTRTTPFVDTTHPSYGTIRILNVTPVP
jgi:hypothetical protein